MNMYKIPKKESENIQSALGKFQKVLATAKARDLNESDTVSIVTDMLGEIFGYDKYLEVTSEFAIRGTFCDLAIKINGKIEYLIECKSIGTELKDNHVKQAVDYGANQGVNWVILTNGIIWRLYKIRFEQPIVADLVYQLDITALNPRGEDSKELVYILHKSAIEKNYRQAHYEKTQLINPYTFAHILLSEPILAAVRRETRKLSEDVKIEVEEVRDILALSVIKRDLLESDEAFETGKRLKKLLKNTKKSPVVKSTEPPTSEQPNPVQSEPNSPPPPIIS